MMIRGVLFLYLFAPVFCQAQHWRVEANAGAAIPVVIGGSKPIVWNVPYINGAAHEIPTDAKTVQGFGGLKLMRRDSAIEYGIGAQALTLHFKNDLIQFHQDTYLARPAIPLTAFFNYCHHRSKAHAFIGLTAGLVFARGREMKDVTELGYYEDFSIYFNNGFGYTLGGQLGFRRVFGKVDVGMQLAMDFVHLSLTQGTSHTPYSYNILYVPLQANVGYSF